MEKYEANWNTLEKEEKDGYIEMARGEGIDYKDEDNLATLLEDAMNAAWNNTTEGKVEVAEIAAANTAKAEAYRNRDLKCTECQTGVTALTSLQIGDEVACANCLREQGLGHKVTW